MVKASEQPVKSVAGSDQSDVI
eukprot:COSAG01_NODE_45362_length_410_cov_0.655949_1_plen_21_part_10